MTNDDESDAFPWHLGVFDAHCHPTDTISSLSSIPSMHANVLTIMATRGQDQQLVARAAEEYGFSESEIEGLPVDWRSQHKIVPAFGWHPWFSHQIFDETEYDGALSLSSEQKARHYHSVLSPKVDDPDFLQCLPEPLSLKEFLGQTRSHLCRYPLALIGEVGLDRSFRIPEAWPKAENQLRDETLTPGGRERRRLSAYRVDMSHQKKVLSAQLRLAGEMQRAVSLHGVAAHGTLYETLAGTWRGHERPVLSKRQIRKSGEAVKAATQCFESKSLSPSEPLPYPPRVCLHSYSGGPETVKLYIAASAPCNVYFSFSTTINSWAEDGEGTVEAAVRAVPDDRILIESDLHTAGDRMDHYLEAAARKICQVKGWPLEIGVQQLGENWKSFVLGTRYAQRAALDRNV